MFYVFTFETLQWMIPATKISLSEQFKGVL